jgi:hypothetical protein
LLDLAYQCSVQDTAPVSAADGGQLPGVTGGAHVHGLVIMTGRAHGRDGAAYPAETIGALGCRAAAASTGGRRIGSTETTKASSADDRAPSPRSARPGLERFKSATIGDRLPRLGEMDAALRTAVDAAEASREPVVEASRPCRLAVSQ